MINAVFDRGSAGTLCGLEISGHAGYDDPGLDIVCASVTSALQLVCNGITEVLHVPAMVSVEENRVSLGLPQPQPQAEALLEALLLHLQLLEQDYPENLKTTVLEV